MLITVSKFIIWFLFLFVNFFNFVHISNYTMIDGLWHIYLRRSHISSLFCVCVCVCVSMAKQKIEKGKKIYFYWNDLFLVQHNDIYYARHFLIVMMMCNVNGSQLFSIFNRIEFFLHIVYSLPFVDFKLLQLRTINSFTIRIRERERESGKTKIVRLVEVGIISEVA